MRKSWDDAVEIGENTSTPATQCACRENQTSHRSLIFFLMLTLNKSLDKSVSCFLENLPKTLREFHVGNSARLKADDFLQSYQLILNVVHR